MNSANILLLLDEQRNRTLVCVNKHLLGSIMMKVCFVSFEYPPRILGGAGTYAELLVKALSRIGVEVFVLASGEKNALEEKICRLNVPDMAYMRQFLFMKLAAKTFSVLRSEHNFDLIHYNEPHMLRSRIGDLPIVSTVHSSQMNEINIMLRFAGSTLTTLGGFLDFTVRSPIGYIGDILTARVSDMIISPSLNLARLFSSQCFVDKGKIRFIPNAVDFEKLDCTKTDNTILEREGLEKDEYILYMGRISPTKGIQYLIEAFRWIKKKARTEWARNLKLVIAGAGGFERSLRRQATGLEGVIFTGFIDTIEAKKSLYSNSLALIVPSLYEAFPMVVLEAMACSRAVIATCVGDIPSIIENGVNGLLVAPRDVKGLAQDIVTLYNDLDLCGKMGVRNRILVKENYTIDKMAVKTLEIYRGLMT